MATKNITKEQLDASRRTLSHWTDMECLDDSELCNCKGCWEEKRKRYVSSGGAEWIDYRESGHFHRTEKPWDKI